MLTNLLSWFKLGVGDAAFYAVFGFAFVFVGIVILVLLFTALGKIMKEANKPRPPRRKSDKVTEPKPLEERPAAGNQEGVTPELIAVISAAVAAYYEGENVKCDFVVKRIRKL